MALSVQFDLTVWQFDIVTAYLNGILEEEVLMKIPDMLSEILNRLVSKQNDNTYINDRAKYMLEKLQSGGNVCSLKKALYGLRQAGRQWYVKLSETLISLGLQPTINEPCLFFGNVNAELVFVLVYVDDILVASRDIKYIIEIKNGLSSHFEIKDLGKANYCLGLEIVQNNDHIVLKQSGYILGLLKQYGMHECNSAITPSEISGRLNDLCVYDALGSEYPYRELIGALMYLSVATRLDIANTLSRLAQHVNKPQKCHWVAAKRLLRYLAGTANIGLVFTKNNEPLIAYSDADWEGCPMDRLSYTGYVFELSGAAISWKSKKQKTVALSSTEAEYVSLTEAAKEALYLQSILYELNLNDWANLTIFIDNRGAQFLAENPVCHDRMKHADIKHHFIRNLINSRTIVLEHVSTKNMIADILTKPLTRINHEKCVKGLGLA